MASTNSAFPAFPPGFWRRIKLYPFPGVVAAGLEDDAHRFQFQLGHEKGKITSLYANAERFPWSTCPDAIEFLSSQLIGKSLQAIARLNPRTHCTHLFDLAILCAAHAENTAPIYFDMQVADRIDRRTTAALLENGTPVLQWQLNGTVIEGPNEWTGRDLRELSTWKDELSLIDAMRAMMLRRAIFVSGVRSQPEIITVARAADRGVSRLGACFTYQMPRAFDAIPSFTHRIDFSHSNDGPLQGFDPEQLRHVR